MDQPGSTPQTYLGTSVAHFFTCRLPDKDDISREMDPFENDTSNFIFCCVFALWSFYLETYEWSNLWFIGCTMTAPSTPASAMHCQLTSAHSYSRPYIQHIDHNLVQCVQGLKLESSFDQDPNSGTWKNYIRAVPSSINHYCHFVCIVLHSETLITTCSINSAMNCSQKCTCYIKFSSIGKEKGVSILMET